MFFIHCACHDPINRHLKMNDFIYFFAALFCSELRRQIWILYKNKSSIILSNGMTCVGFIDFFKEKSFVRNFSHMLFFTPKKHICWKANLLHIFGQNNGGNSLLAYINCHPISRFSKVSREWVTLCGSCTNWQGVPCEKLQK